MEEREAIDYYYERYNEWALKAHESYQWFIKSGSVTPPQYPRLSLDNLRQLKVNSVRNRLTFKNLKFASNVCINGTIHLDISSSLCGRTRAGASDVFDIFYDDDFKDAYTDEFILWSGIYCLTPDKEETSFSDFAVERAHKLLFKMLMAETPEKKYLYIDQLIHLTHWNGDLTYLYVIGGENTLDNVSNRNQNQR